MKYAGRRTIPHDAAYMRNLSRAHGRRKQRARSGLRGRGGGGSAREAEGDAVPLLHDTQATPHGTPNNCVESNLMLNALIFKKKKKKRREEETSTGDG